MEGPRVYFQEHTQANEQNEPVQLQSAQMLYFVTQLPRLHEQSDSLSVLPNGKTLCGPLQHDEYMPRSLRNAALHRITWMNLNGSQKIGFMAMPDWTFMDRLPFVQPQRPQEELLLLKWNSHYVNGPLLYTFFVNCLDTVFKTLIYEHKHDENASSKICLRLWPLISKKVVPENILSSVSFCYASALLTILYKQIDPVLFAHVQIADFLDVSAEPFLSLVCHQNLNYVPVTSVKQMSHQDFIEVVPSDSFCLPGLHPNSLEFTLTQNTNIQDVLCRPWTPINIQAIDMLRHGWPTLPCHATNSHQTMVPPMHRPLSYRQTIMERT